MGLFVSGSQVLIYWTEVCEAFEPALRSNSGSRTESHEILVSQDRNAMKLRSEMLDQTNLRFRYNVRGVSSEIQICEETESEFQIKSESNLQGTGFKNVRFAYNF